MRFVLAFLSLLFTTQLAIVGINVFIDEDGRLWRGMQQERWMAEEMHKGNNIAGRQNFRIRALVTEVIRQADAAPETIVLGSSRAMLLGENLLGQNGVRNHSISSARLVHYYSVLGQYAERGMKPDSILIGADPWIFKNEQLIIWPMEAGAQALASQLGVEPTHLGINAKLPWTSYFSWKKTYGPLAEKPAQDNCDQPTLLRNDDTPCAMRRFDGSLKYPGEQINKSTKAVADEVRGYARGRMHSYEGYRELDPVRIQQFRRLLAYLKVENIRTGIILAPYHPLVEEHQSGRRDWKLTQEAEQTIRDIAAEMDIPVVGAYSAHVAQCTEAEFYDGIHARESCMKRILAPLIGTQKDRKIIGAVEISLHRFQPVSIMSHATG